MSAPGLKITNFHYAGIHIPKGELMEYPKWIHMDGQPSVVVNNEDEELELLSRPEKS